jgi:hypothetical protein
MKKLILEFDDLNPNKSVDCLATIKDLVNAFPNIKMTFFTSALYERTALFSDKEWCSEIRNLIESNNIRLAVHGLYHTQEEFKYKTKDDALLCLNIAESVFKTSNLPFIKVFRGPHWGINDNTYESLIHLGYTHVYTHDDYIELSKRFSGMKNVIYNWNLKDKFEDIRSDFIIGHGHTHNVCGNGINESYQRIVDFIEEYSPQFLFADDYE